MSHSLFAQWHHNIPARRLIEFYCALSNVYPQPDNWPTDHLSGPTQLTRRTDQVNGIHIVKVIWPINSVNTMLHTRKIIARRRRLNLFSAGVHTTIYVWILIQLTIRGAKVNYIYMYMYHINIYFTGCSPIRLVCDQGRWKFFWTQC